MYKQMDTLHFIYRFELSESTVIEKGQFQIFSLEVHEGKRKTPIDIPILGFKIALHSSTEHYLADTETK